MCTASSAALRSLLSVGGRPFLDWVLDNLGRHGVERVILTVGYRAEAFEEWIASRGDGVTVSTFVETEALGTGGALPLLADRLDPAFFVLNGDTLFDVPLPELGHLLLNSEDAGAVALRSVPDTSRYGRVQLDGARIVDFEEKGAEGPGLINGGVYALRREAITSLGSPSSIERDLLPGLAQRSSLTGLEADGFFIDIGVPHDFEEAQVRVPEWWAETAGG